MLSFRKYLARKNKRKKGRSVKNDPDHVCSFSVTQMRPICFVILFLLSKVKRQLILTLGSDSSMLVGISASRDFAPNLLISHVRGSLGLQGRKRKPLRSRCFANFSSTFRGISGGRDSWKFPDRKGRVCRGSSCRLRSTCPCNASEGCRRRCYDAWHGLVVASRHRFGL